MNLYFDSAYVAKCYVNEPDPPSVRALARRATHLYSSWLSVAEVACTFYRHVREGALAASQAVELHQAFRADVANGLWLLSPCSEDVLQRVDDIVQKLPPMILIRGGDAIHLVTARQAGFPDIWTNDRRLLAAAPYFDVQGRSV